MIRQEIRLSFLFVSAIFTIIAVGDYFGAGEAFPALISTAFIVLLFGNIADLILGWKLEKRRVDLGIDEREYSRLMRRETD